MDNTKVSRNFLSLMQNSTLYRRKIIFWTVFLCSIHSVLIQKIFKGVKWKSKKRERANERGVNVQKFVRKWLSWSQLVYFLQLFAKLKLSW